jgi:hypothetical protein
MWKTLLLYEKEETCKFFHPSQAAQIARKISANYDATILMGLATNWQGLYCCQLANQQFADSGYDYCNSVPNTVMLST